MKKFIQLISFGFLLVSFPIVAATMVTGNPNLVQQEAEADVQTQTVFVPNAYQTYIPGEVVQTYIPSESVETYTPVEPVRSYVPNGTILTYSPNPVVNPQSRTYYYLRVNDVDKVCYSSEQEPAFGLNAVLVEVKLTNNTLQTLQCYDANQKYFEGMQIRQ